MPCTPPVYAATSPPCLLHDGRAAIEIDVCSRLDPLLGSANGRRWAPPHPLTAPSSVVLSRDHDRGYDPRDGQLQHQLAQTEGSGRAHPPG